MLNSKNKAFCNIMIETVAVIVGPLIVLGMIFYVYLKSNHDEIKENWVQYRCNPIYMPFAGMFADNVAENFHFCVSAMAGQFFAYALAPVHLLFKLFTQAIQIVLNQMDVFRAFITAIQKFVTSFFAGTLGKISNTFGVLIHLLSILRDLTGRIVSSGAYAAIIMSTGVNFVLSLFSFMNALLKSLVGLIFGLAIILLFVFPPLLFFFIPIGVAIGVSYSGGCFHPSTLVGLADGRTLPISEIKVGDVLANTATVTATMRFTPRERLYTYRGVVRVTGSHLVRDSDGVWRKVEDSPNSIPYEGAVPAEIICLNTSNHKLYIHGCYFADFDEIEPTKPSEPLLGTNTVRRKGDNAAVELQTCYPGLETDCGEIVCVIDMGDGMRQVIVDNSLGRLRINDTRWVVDYLGDEHNPILYGASQRRALRELNRGIHNNEG